MDASRLRTLPMFARMDDEELRRIATFATEESASAGTVLVREGDYSTELIAIEEGTADVVRSDGPKLGSLGPGDVFGEMGVLTKEQRTASVIATSPMRLIKLSMWDVKRLGPETKARLRALVEERRASDRLRGAPTHAGTEPA
jgi:CRP-like cAMP-binding protein